MSDSGAGDGKEERKPRKSRFDKPEDKEKKRRERWRDEKLNPLSPNFKPLDALYASKTILLDTKAPAYDNLGKYESVMEGKAASSSAVSKKSAKHVEYTDLPVRDLTDTFDNVMKWMKEIDGPMKAFQFCMEKKVKVKIVTRAATDIRGHVIGYVTAFDKLWNLAVEDAVEVWTRKRKQKSIPTSGAIRRVPPETQHLRMAAPPVKVTSVNKKIEKCERKVDKLLLRGEHVVLVSIVDY